MTSDTTAPDLSPLEITRNLLHAADTTLALPAVMRTRIENGKVTEYTIFIDPSPVVAAS